MSFRQPKSRRHVEGRAWQAWLARHEPALKAIGLPPSVTLSEAHWTDFLQNGYLEWHPESWDGFYFARLSAAQMAALSVVLDASPQYAREPMVGWIQYRLGRAGAG